MSDDKTNDDFIKLPSGGEVYADYGILGIGPALEVSGGYDGSITNSPPDCGYLTPGEVNELCDIAIERWQRLKALVATLETRPEV